MKNLGAYVNTHTSSVESTEPTGTNRPRTSKRRVFSLVAAATVAALAFTGCAAQADTDSSDDGSGAAVEGGTLRIGIPAGSAADVNDPHVILGGYQNFAAGAFYEQLAVFDDNYEFQPVLAEEFTPNDDNTVWTVTLKPDVKFHDGSDFDADDVIYSFERMLDPESGAIAAGQVGMVESMTKIDDLTVEFSLNTPTNFFPTAVAAGGAQAILPEGFDPENPISTAPFQLESFEAGVGATYTRFDDYHGDVAALDAVELVVFNDDEAMTNALVSSQIDVAWTLPATQVARVESDPNLGLYSRESGEFVVLTMRTDTGPTADNRIRQAIRMALDREQVVEVVYAGHATVANDLYAPFDPAFADDLVRERDVEGAKQLVADAGAEGLEVIFSVTANRDGAAQVAALNAREIGLDASVEIIDEATYWGNYPNWDIGVDLYPSMNFMPIAAMSDGPNAFLNQTGFSNERYNELFILASEAPTEEEAAEYIHEMQQILFDEGGYLIPTFGNILFGHVAGLQNLPEADRSGYAFHRNLNHVTLG